MAEEARMSTGNTAWNGINSVLGVGALGAALGIGIPALSRNWRNGGCGWNGNGCGGYGYGWNGGCGRDFGVCGENTIVNRFELEQSQQISELKSARETDTKILDTYKALVAADKAQDAKFAQLTKELTDYVIANNRVVDEIRCEERLNNQEIRDNLRFLDYKIASNDASIRAYVDCKTIPLEKKIGINQICPTPLAACTPITTNAQVIATTPATTEGEVSLNTTRVSK